MKKLKTVLILLLALLLSLGLFACGGGKDDNPGGDGDQNQDNPNDPDNPDNPGGDESDYADFVLSKSVINLTDSDDDAALQSKLGEVKVTLRDFDSNETDVSLDRCNYDLSVVKVHEVGEYKVEFSIKDLSVLRNSRTLTVIIEHDWEAKGDIDVCKHDGARRETTDEDVVIHYGTFHDGIYPRDYDTAKAAAGWEEADAYTNKNTTSSIKKFGEVNGKEVPTLTAGQLEQGMTITISGQVKTTVGDDQTGAGSPWGTNGVQKYYNSPSLGVADRFNHNVQNGSVYYPYGVSVIVREEGWVLYNGISGSGANRLLAGITGSDAEDIGTWRNYGSHVDAADPFTPGTSAESGGYTHGSIPTNWDNVQNWWVYSEGTTMSSGTYYLDWMNYEYSWNYRDDGVIEITYKAWGTTQTIADATTLKAYIKVPDSTSGYYDTIIHGDYNDMTIEKTVTITKNTPQDNGFVYHELADDAKLVYAENTEFDASLLNVTVKYEQSPDKDTPLKVYNNQVYYYVGEMTRDQLNAAENSAELKSLDSSKWKSLDQNLLTLNGNRQYLYKIQLTKGGKEWTYLLPDGEITVKPNSVVTATGSDVTIANEPFANNGKLGELAFSFDGANVKFTLAEGYAQPMSGAQKTAMGVSGNSFYVALRLDKAELGAAFNAEAITAKMGNDGVTVKAVTVDYEGRSDLYLVLALNKAGSVTLTDVQTTPIVLDLTALKGFEITSTITGADGLLLNKGGDITLTYQLPAGTKADDIAFVTSRGVTRINAALQGSYNDNGDLVPYSPTNPYDAGNSKVTGFTYVEATGLLTIKASVPAANLANYAPLTYEVDLYKNGSLVDSLVDTINYKMELGTANGYVAGENGYYAYVTESGKLNVVWATNTDKLADGKIGGSFQININNGDLGSFKKNGLTSVTYKVENGRLVLVNAPAYVTGAVTLVGTYGNDRDKDAGAFVVFTIDVATGLEITGDYYVEFVGGVFDPTTAPTNLNKVSGTALTTVTLDNTYKTEIVSTADGNCYEEGLYGWQVSKDNTVLCFANVASAGGDHIDADGNKVCDLCGGKMETAPLPEWEEKTQSYTINEGEVVDMVATYNEAARDIPTTDFGMFGPYVSVVSGNRYWLRTDGWLEIILNDDWGQRGHVPYDEALRPEGIQTAHTDLVNNVLNGVVTNDGVTLDTVSASNFAAWLAGKTVHYVVSYTGTTVTVKVSYYKPDGSLSLSYKFYVYDVTGSIKVDFMCDDGIAKNYETNVGIVGNPTFTKSSSVNSVIDKVESATVDSHTAPEAIKYATNTGNGYVNVNLSGKAQKEGEGYYASFKITFSSALVGSTTVKLVDKDGKAITGGKAILADNKLSLEVYLPITDGLTEAYLDFTNYEASTKQADIKIDLTNLAASNVTATETLDNVNLGAGTFTIAYTNVEGTDTLTIGGVSKTLAELTTKQDFAYGISATATAVANGNVTVTFTKAAADLSKVVVVPEIRLERNGSLLYMTSLDNALIATGTEIDSTGWYVTASGNKLILTTNTVDSADSLILSLNAGAKTSKELLIPSDLGFKVVSGAVSFNSVSVLSRIATANYSASSNKHLVAIVFDLTTLGVADNVAYGYTIESEDVTHFYKVNGARAITVETKASTDKTELQKASCEQDGFTAHTVGEGESATFYYGVEYVKGEHHFPADGGVCTVCNKVTGWKVDEVVVGTEGSGSAGWTDSAPVYDPADTEKFGAITKGQKAVFEGTIKAATTSINNSWLNAHGVNVKIGGVIIRSDGWSNTLDASSGEYEANSWAINVQVELQYDGKVVSGGAVPWGDAVANCKNDGTATVTIDWTQAAKIIITMEFVGAEHTFKQVSEIIPADSATAFGKDLYEIGLMPVMAYFNGTLTVTGDAEAVPAEKCNQWIREPGSKIPDPEYTADTEITKEGGLVMGTIGTPGKDTEGWVGYSNTPNWISKFEKGDKIVLSGTQKSAANQPYWSSLTFFVWSSEVSTMPTKTTADPGICMNHANGGAGHDETFSVSGPSHKLTGGTDYTALIEQVGADCEVTITFDWTQYNKQFTVTMKIEKDEKAVEATYTFTVKDGQELAEYYNIGVGVDHSYANLTSIDRTEKAPTQDLPGIAYDEMKEDGSLGVGFTNYVKQGEVVTLTGTMKIAEVDVPDDNGGHKERQAWRGYNVTLFTGPVPAGMMLRDDRWIENWGNPTWTNEYQWDQDGIKIKVAIVATGTFSGVEGDEFAKLSSIIDDCTFEIKFDYQTAGTLIVTYKITDANGTDFVLNTYTIAATDAATKALPEQFNFKVGAGDATVISGNTLSATVTGRQA